MTSPTERDDGRVRSDFPGGWAGDKRNAFSGTGLSPAARRNQALVRNLLQFRRQSPALTQGDLIHFVPKEGVYVYARRSAEQTVLVAINRSAEPRRIALSRFDEALQGQRIGVDVITGTAIELASELELPKHSSRVISMPAGAR